MGRKRQIVIDQDEDIVSYEHNLAGKFVRVSVGVGTALPDSSFIVSENQTFESYIIEGPEYENLMLSGVFSRNDLWPFVDSSRAEKQAERDKIKEEKVPKEEKNVKP